MAEYSRMAKGSFTASGTSAIINLPFQPDYVELWNYSNIKTAATHKVTRAWWDNKLNDSGVNPTMLELYSGSSTAVVFDQIQTNGISTFAAGQMLQYGATQQIIGITAASPAVFNVTAHGYNVGDTIVAQGIALATTNNMQLLNGVQFTISAVGDANHFSVKWDASGGNYTAISGSPAGTLVKKVLYPFLYPPQVNVVTAITTGSTTTIQTAMYSNVEIGQEVAFRIPSFWGTTQLNSLPDLLIPGSPIYGYVVSITDNWTFVVSTNSTGFTAFTNNGTMTAGTLSGLTYAQQVAVGDVNTGGKAISAGSVLYPPPQFPISSNQVNTINGPAIKGAFVNNTSQGFIIGPGVAVADGTATMIANGNIVLWHAYLHDFASP